MPPEIVFIGAVVAVPVLFAVVLDVVRGIHRWRRMGVSPEPWYLRLARQALPLHLRGFEDELQADREDAIEYAAAHPGSRRRWSDARETFDCVVVILKHQISSIKIEWPEMHVVGSTRVVGNGGLEPGHDPGDEHGLLHWQDDVAGKLYRPSWQSLALHRAARSAHRHR
jgi:hypothetical protein